MVKVKVDVDTNAMTNHSVAHSIQFAGIETRWWTKHPTPHLDRSGLTCGELLARRPIDYFAF